MPKKCVLTTHQKKYQNVDSKCYSDIKQRIFQVCENETLKLVEEICIFLYTAVKDLLKQNFKDSR